MKMPLGDYNAFQAISDVIIKAGNSPNDKIEPLKIKLDAGDAGVSFLL